MSGATKNSVCATGPRVMRQKRFAAHKPVRAKVGFDYPTTLIGTSTWKGSDGTPVTIYCDPATGQAGTDVAKYVLSKIDALMASCDAWFGVRGLGGNVIVAPDFGGAYHYGCSFDQGGDWYESLSGNDTTLGLVMAEVVESYMGLQNKGWNCGGSGGEGLSRFLAEVATGGADGAMSAYAAGPSWDGTDWISADQGTDQDYPSIGCSILYCWWMTKLGFTVQQIVQAGEPDGTLATNYAKLTGKPATQAFADFKAAVGTVGGPGGFQDDNPFLASEPPYPATGGPPPPPPQLTVSVSPSSGPVPLAVTATVTGDISSGVIVDFGDGTVPATTSPAAHTYQSAGTFTVVATTVAGSATATVTAGGITPPPPPPPGGFTGTVTETFVNGVLANVVSGAGPIAPPPASAESVMTAELVKAKINPNVIADVLKLFSDIRSKAGSAVIFADLLAIITDLGVP